MEKSNSIIEMRPAFMTTDREDMDYIQEFLYNDLNIESDWGCAMGRYVVSVPVDQYYYAVKEGRVFFPFLGTAVFVNDEDYIKDVALTQLCRGILPENFRDVKGNPPSLMLCDEDHHPVELKEYLRSMQDYIKATVQVQYIAAHKALDIDMLNFNQEEKQARLKEFVLSNGNGPFEAIYPLDEVGRYIFDEKGQKVPLLTKKG